MIYLDYFLLVIRILLGATALYHGWLKLADIKSTSRIFKKMGFAPAALWTIAFGINEFAGGVFIITGFYAELFALLFIFEILITTIWQIIAKDSFHHISYGLQLIALSSIVTIFGSGAYAITSIDTGIFLEWWSVALILAISAILAYLNQPIPKTKTEAGE